MTTLLLAFNAGDVTAYDNFVLNLMDFALKMMDFVLQMQVQGRGRGAWHGHRRAAGAGGGPDEPRAEDRDPGADDADLQPR